VKQIESIGARGIAVVGDVSDEATVEMMIQQVVKKLGSLDVMVSVHVERGCETV
jgi:NAD(P)-dependent dehydrogenase (short-subunit alcohol dehydrogenase family)